MLIKLLPQVTEVKWTAAPVCQ